MNADGHVDGVTFTVRQDGEPHLAEEGQDAPPPEDVSGPVPVLLDTWTAQEAAALCSAVFNVGVLIYGPLWTADPREFQASGTLLAPTLDRFLPKSGGGGLATMGLGLVSVAGELAAAGARRWPLLKQGPRPIWVPAEAAEQSAKGAPAPAPPTEPGPAAAPSSSTGPYRMPPDLVAVVERGSQASALVGLGL